MMNTLSIQTVRNRGLSRLLTALFHPLTTANAIVLVLLLCIGVTAFGSSNLPTPPDPQSAKSTSATASFTASQPIAASASAELDKKGQRALRKTKKRELKERLRSLRDDLKKQKKAKGSGDGGKKLLVVFLGLLVLFGFFALGIAIANGGNEMLGGLVFFLGLMGVVIGMAFTIQGINKNKNPKKR